MNIEIQKPQAINDTVQRLLALEPGEAFTYYKDHSAEDVASSKGAPTYARLLAEIEATARELQTAGRIAVTERNVTLTRDGQRFRITEYGALGLALEAQARDDENSGAEPDEAAAA
jgi:hypothetical protein